MSSTHITLIQRVKDPTNENAWEVFSAGYSEYIDKVLSKGGIFPDDIKDLRQDILFKLWKKLPEFNYEPKKGKFRSWLYVIIRNTTSTFITAQSASSKRTQQYFQTLQKNEPPENTDLNTLLDDEWKEYLCVKALSQLSDVFSAQSIEIFKDSLKGEAPEVLAKKYKLKENTIYRIKNRVKERLIIEIQRLRDDLE